MTLFCTIGRQWPDAVLMAKKQAISTGRQQTVTRRQRFGVRPGVAVLFVGAPRFDKWEEKLMTVVDA